MKNKIKISVVIPTYNSWETLKACISSVLRQTLKPLEIIVVDNGSTDGTSANTRKQFPDIKLIRLEQNTGVTGGRNIGIKAANKKADYLLFFDHDMVAERSMLFNLVNGVEGDVSIGIAAPKIYYWQDKTRIWSAGTGINLWTGQVVFRGGNDEGQFEKIEDVEVAPAVMLVKQQVVNSIKRFDEKYFTTFEDTDFCFRAKKKQFRTIYIPWAVAYHKIPVDPKEEARRLLDRAFWIGRNRILFMKDFGKNFYIFALFIPLYCIYYFKLAIENKRSGAFILFIRGLISGLVLTR